MTVAEANRATVARLMTILSGDTPIHAGAELIADDVVAHVDGWRFQGINVWANWIDYIRSRGRVASPTLVLDAIEVHADATVTARGRWQGVRRGRTVTSAPASATYRLAHGKIVEIRSTRGNYGFLCGSHVRTQVGLALELVRCQVVRMGKPRIDLEGGARTAVEPRSTAGPSLLGSGL